ncbi:MAG: hypothetical protein ABI321_14470 [Polyangia bacterium]
MADISGFAAILGAQDQFSMPGRCCRCGEPADKTIASSVQVKAIGRGRRTRSVTFPYCTACFERAARVNRARSMLTLTILGLSLLLACLAFVVPGLPQAALIVVPTGLALFAAFALTSRSADATHAPYGAWLSKATNDKTTFFMTRPEWAAQFGEGNKVPSVPMQLRGGPMMWPLALIVAAGLSTLLSFLARPEVHIDNEGPTAVQIWIDGKKSIVAPPLTAKLEPRPIVRVPFGMHRFGWSAEGASAPTAQTDPYKIVLAGDHLYNPGSTACYYLDLSLYGSGASAGTINAGPVSIAEMYTFKQVDSWFSENPKSVSTKSSTEKRVSLQPEAGCFVLSEHHCALSIRKDLAECRKTAYEKEDKDGYTSCFTRAVEACHKLEQ